MSTAPQMMEFHVPSDQSLLAAIGLVTLAHSHLDHILRMTIKTLANVEVHEALDATAYDGSRVLRERIRKLAKQKLGEGEALVKIQALLERCGRATARRNELVHSIWARPANTVAPQIRTMDHEWRPIPTVEQLEALLRDLSGLTLELNTARLEGFLLHAIKARERVA